MASRLQLFAIYLALFIEAVMAGRISTSTFVDEPFCDDVNAVGPLDLDDLEPTPNGVSHSVIEDVEVREEVHCVLRRVGPSIRLTAPDSIAERHGPTRNRTM